MVGALSAQQNKRTRPSFWIKIVLGIALLVLFLLLPVMRQTATLPKKSNANIFWSSLSSGLPSLSLTPFSTNSTLKQGHESSSNPAASRTEDTKGGNKSNFKIIGFTDELYLAHAERWFQELTRPPLSYPKQNVVVGAMSLATLKSLQARNITAQPCGFNLADQNDLTEPPPTKLRPQRRRRRLFAARWKCVLEELQKGVHVVLTDVDNHFTRHIPVMESFGTWNVIHSYSNGFPGRLHAKYGFTVCGCLSWLQSHPATIRYVKRLVQQCGEECDDQIVLNSVLLEEMKVNWTVDRTSLVEHDPQQILNKLVKQTTNTTLTTKTNLVNQPNWKQPYAARYGHSNVTGHSIYVWNREFAYRGPVEAVPCPRTLHNWVAMPSNQKGQKTAGQWEHYCPRPKVRA